MTKSRVVILGSGYAGTQVAVTLDKLSKQFDVVVVDSREAQIHKIGALRAAVEDSWWPENVNIPREKMLKHGKFVQAKVEAVDANKVSLSNGQTLEFDYLVCATGAYSLSVGEPNLKLESRNDVIRYYKDTGKVVERANNIVILGGGAVGVELAGEIRDKYPAKSITIIQSADSLLPEISSKAKSKLNGVLASRNIKVMLNVKVNVSLDQFEDSGYIEGEQSLSLSDGSTISTDLVFCAVGSKPNSQFYPKEWIGPDQRIQVKATFQLLNGPENIFAVGDVCDINEMKTAYRAGLQGAAAAANIKAFAKGKKLNQYSASSSIMMFLPVGASHGISVLPIGVLGSWVTRLVKGKSLFVSNYQALNKYRKTDIN